MARLARFRTLFDAYSGHRCRFSISSATEADKKPPHPGNIKNDMIGPPNQVSNLRPVIFHIPDNESPLAQQFRLKREEVQRWNEEFWVKHNSAFIKESNEFRVSKFGSLQNSEKKSLSAEEMSEFYKTFLDKNWKAHVLYNFEWYCKNLNLIVLALRVQLAKVGLWKR